MADVEMLQALHGDAFILHCQKNGNDGVIVVDGGPNRDSRKIVSQLDALETIDLMVLTHYDDDHIGGVLAYIKKHKSDRPFPVKHLWVNCAYDIPVYSSPNISFGQANKLADELKDINEGLVKDGFSAIDWKTPIIAKKEPITLLKFRIWISSRLSILSKCSQSLVILNNLDGQFIRVSTNEF